MKPIERKLSEAEKNYVDVITGKKNIQQVESELTQKKTQQKQK